VLRFFNNTDNLLAVGLHSQAPLRIISVSDFRDHGAHRRRARNVLIHHIGGMYGMSSFLLLILN
jgi:hypothetical protein